MRVEQAYLEWEVNWRCDHCLKDNVQYIAGEDYEDGLEHCCPSCGALIRLPIAYPFKEWRPFMAEQSVRAARIFPPKGEFSPTFPRNSPQ